MLAQELIERAQNAITSEATDQPMLDVDELLDLLEQELSELAMQEDWPALHIHLDPIAKTDTGVREYNLPKNFGTNFIVRSHEASGGGAVDGTPRHMVKISDGSNEQFLTYKTPGDLFAADQEAATNTKPTAYTIVTKLNGRKQIYLDPPPDSNSDSHYEIRGIYKPIFARLEHPDWLPDEFVSYLLYALLLRVNPEHQLWQLKLGQARRDLYLMSARGRDSQIVPRMGETPGVNDYGVL